MRKRTKNRVIVTKQYFANKCYLFYNILKKLNVEQSYIFFHQDYDINIYIMTFIIKSQLPSKFEQLRKQEPGCKPKLRAASCRK